MDLKSDTTGMDVKDLNIWFKIIIIMILPLIYFISPYNVINISFYFCWFISTLVKISKLPLAVNELNIWSKMIIMIFAIN